MSYTLYPYQQEGESFLTDRRRAYLAYFMGSGKSLIALSAARKVGANRVSVICPAVAVPNWQAECDKWDLRPEEFHVQSYSMALRHGAPAGQDLVILDEAHYCKSPGAKRTRIALRHAAEAERAWLLSGTPMPNHPGELYAPIRFLWPEVCKRHNVPRSAEWQEKFCKLRPTVYGPKPYGVRNAEILRAELRKIMLRKRLEDVALDLPPLRIDTMYLPEAPAVTAALEESGYTEYNEQESEEVYTSTLRRLLGEAKAPLIANQIAEELQDGAYEKIVVLYYHREAGRILQSILGRGQEVVGFGGGASGSARQAAVDNFQSGTARVFLAQQSAAGIAINLTAATEIVLAEPAWTPDDNDQAIKRIHRIGQDRPCRARIFCVTGTLDEQVMGTVARKLTTKTEVGL